MLAELLNAVLKAPKELFPQRQLRAQDKLRMCSRPEAEPCTPPGGLLTQPAVPRFPHLSPASWGCQRAQQCSPVSIPLARTSFYSAAVYVLKVTSELFPRGAHPAP